MNKNLKAHLAALAANLIYGANYSISKGVMPLYIKPAGFILLRVFISLLLFLLFLALFVKKEETKIERKDYFRFFLCGLFGVAVNQLLFFEGLARTSAINAALIISTNPVLVLLAASYILKDVITSRKILGIALGVAGAALLILSENSVSSKHGSWHGDALIFINAASYAVFLVMAKPLMSKYSPYRVITWTFFFGFLLVIPFGTYELSAVNWESFDTGVWIAVIYICFFSTFLAYLLNMYGLRQLSPAVLSFYIYLQPIFATLISLSISGESVTLMQVVSCAMIFGGVYLVSDTTTKERPK